MLKGIPYLISWKALLIILLAIQIPITVLLLYINVHCNCHFVCPLNMQSEMVL